MVRVRLMVLLAVSGQICGAVAMVSPAFARGCEVLPAGGAQRADCETHVRERAQDEVRMERERLTDDARGATSDVVSGRSQEWRDAVKQAEGPHLDSFLEVRPIAAIVGTLWFVLLARRRWRRPAR